MSILPRFDFRILDDKDFKEDSVREEIIVPIYQALGYSASGELNVKRGQRLKNPIINFGTASKTITMVPDYVFYYRQKPIWILEAKSPSVDIQSHEFVSQAYSYASHREIDAPLYALTNGRRFIVYLRSKEDPLLDFSIMDLDQGIRELAEILNHQYASSRTDSRTFLPDFGLYLKQTGLGYDESGTKRVLYFFTSEKDDLSFLDNDTVSINGRMIFEGREFLATYDFDFERMKELIASLPHDVGALVIETLQKPPHKFRITGPQIFDAFYQIGMSCELADNATKSVQSHEDFLPMTVLSFFN